MKKYLWLLAPVSLSTIANSSIILTCSTTNLILKNETNWQLPAIPHNTVENWYKFLAPNEWKVFITRKTWIKKILAWIGDGLIGKINNTQVRDEIYKEYKSWPSSGNRNFDGGQYVILVNYTLDHMFDISNLIFNNEKINRVVFKTYSCLLYTSPSPRDA